MIQVYSFNPTTERWPVLLDEVECLEDAVYVVAGVSGDVEESDRRDIFDSLTERSYYHPKQGFTSFFIRQEEEDVEDL